MFILKQGDALSLIKEIPMLSIDLILSDYPFNTQDGRKDYIDFIHSTALEFDRVLSHRGILVVINNPYNMWKSRNCFDHFHLLHTSVLLRRHSFNCAWHVPFTHNYLYVFSKTEQKLQHLPEVITYQNGYRQGKIFHPQAIPLELTKDILRLYSKDDATVLDPFMGSGTTAVACLQLNRKVIGFEIKEEYINLITSRIQKEVK